MNIEDLKTAQSKLVDAILVLDSAIEGITNLEDPERQSIEGFQRNVQGIVGELAVKVARIDKGKS